MARRLMKNMTEPELKRMFSGMAAMLEEVLPAGPSPKGCALFTLLVFDEPGLTQYVSNCDRSTMVRALREAADRLERQEVIPR